MSTLVMMPARLVRRLSRRLRRLVRDKRGVSAVEFAMLLPLMVTLYLGGVEISQAVAIDRKVTLISRTLADLVAQVTSVNSTDMQNILAASSAIIAPYPTTTLKITVSRVDVSSSNVATIIWSKANSNGTARTVGQVVTLPSALNVANTSLIWGEAKYGYTPTMGYVITGTLTLSDQIYMAPRLSTSVVCNSC